MITMPKAMIEATYAIVQTGDLMQTYDPIHPTFKYFMTNVFNTTTRCFWSDTKGDTVSNNSNNSNICQQNDGSTPMLYAIRNMPSKQKQQNDPLYVKNNKMIHCMYISQLSHKDGFMQILKVSW